MKVKIEGQNVRIECAGIELLKLKSLLATKISSSLSSGRDFILFPSSFLPSVANLIDITEADNEVNKVLNAFKLHETARSRSIEIIELNEQPTLCGNWNKILEPAQISAVAAMNVDGLLGLCLFDEQGGGKTVMTIAAFDQMKESGLIDAMIVVCPKSMVDEWPKDVFRFLNDKYKIEIAEGDRRRKYEISQNIFDILVTNYESVDSMLVSLKAGASVYRYLLVVDESYYIKNSGSYRSETIRILREKCHKCFVLCGTPAPNSAYDLVNQFDLADLGYTFGGFKKSNDPSRDWSIITSLVEAKGIFIRRLKSDILRHIPKKNFHVIGVELTGKQALMYDKAKSDLILELRSLDNKSFKKSLATYFQRRSVLLQICSCPSAIDPTDSEIPAKYTELDKLLDSLILKGRKVIIWSFYKKSLDEIIDRYSKYKPVKVDGSVSNTDRKEAIRSFQEDSSIMLFVGNPAAAGAGITLHAAYDAVYISYSNQAAHYLQSLDRIHRRGQISNEVNYYLLICNNTIEETEVVRLRGKEIRQHNLLGDHIDWPTSLDDALKELGING